MKYLLIGILLVVVGLLILSRLSNRVPEGLGVSNGQLAQCPSSNNCVSSQASDETKRIPPIEAHGPSKVVMVDLAHAINSLDGSRVTDLNDCYLRAEFTSRVWRFVDDVECYYDQKNGVIHIRSASRVGYADFGVNRSRLEELRIAMSAK